MVYSLSWENMICIKMVSADKPFNELRELFNEYEDNNETMNSVVIRGISFPFDDLIAIYQDEYANAASIIFYSPYESEVFYDEEISLFDLQFNPPSKQLTLYVENGNEKEPFAVFDFSNDTFNIIYNAP